MMTALVFYAVGILGITARSSYIGSNQSLDMPSSNLEVGSLGGAAAEIVQSAVGGRSVR